jgi:peptide/nickel transport system substrate-binding protein
VPTRGTRAAALFTSLLCACQPDARAPGITLLIESVPDSLDGRLALSVFGERLAQLITPGLLTFDDESRPVPDLAESFAWRDALTLEFRLRPGLVFHDGQPLTAADVAATYGAILTRAFPSTKADKYTAIENVEAVDPLTVLFHLRQPYVPLLAELGLGIVPSRRALSTEGPPIGAGPFRFLAQPDDEHLELVPFERYYAGAPRIRALHVRVVRDETTRTLELLKGRADLALNAVSPAVLPQLEGHAGLRVVTTPGTGFVYLGFNVRSGPLADVRVRRAVCHLLDIPAIAEHKFHGLARPATGMLAQNHWAYAATPGCQRDLAEAARLLDAAGYPVPPGGGPRLRLSYKTSTERFRKSLALVLQASLAEGGVAVDLRALEFGTLFNDVRKGNFEMVTLKWSTTFEPNLMRQVFSSSEVPSEANHFGGLNRGGYANPELDGILARAAQAGQDDRRHLYAHALEILDRDLPYAPLWHEDTVAVVSSHLAGFHPSAHGFLSGLASATEVP